MLFTEVVDSSSQLADVYVMPLHSLLLQVFKNLYTLVRYILSGKGLECY